MRESIPHSAGDSTPSIYDQVSNRVQTMAVELGEGSMAGAAVPRRALWRVFHEFGRAYRQRRQEEGVAPLSNVRVAAEAFRRQPTLASLVTVASVLEQNGFSNRPV
jgi:hypothetical protein